MAKKQCIARLRKECERLVKEPVPHIACAPLEDNILEWHFAISAPPATPFEGGCYHGKLVFPAEYPYR
jgi:ubiquitin-conjugating enzyme E2 J2